MDRKIKPKIYGGPTKKRRGNLTKSQRKEIQERKERQKPYVLAGLCCWLITIAIIVPIAIHFGFKNKKD